MLGLARADNALADNDKTLNTKPPYRAGGAAQDSTYPATAGKSQPASPLTHCISQVFWMRLMSNLRNIIAVVDDDPEIRVSLERLLSAYGYDVEIFDLGETFLGRAPTCRAFCLVVDIHLGDITGVELAHRLAADGFKFPIIFMTGHRDARIEEQAFAAGCVAFLNKPFQATTLIDALMRCK